MIDQIKFSYPLEFILICLVAAFLFTVVLYWKDQKFSQARSLWKWIMAGLRFLSCFLIAVLLLSPFIKKITEDIKKPIIVYAQDASSSMLQGEDLALETYFSNRDNMLNDLSEDYDIVKLKLGEQVAISEVDSFQDKSTNISALMDFVNDQYGDQNLGALILATDGIYNEGSNPIYRESIRNVPIFSVAFGDSTAKKDVLIKNIFNNKIAYLGDQFPIQVDIESKGFTGSNVKVDFYEVKEGNSVKLDSKTVNINRDKYFTTVEFNTEAKQVGTVKYQIRLSNLSGEFSQSNNSKSFYVDIIDSRQKFLLLAHAAHPDISTLKNIIEGNKNYQLDIKYASEVVPNLKEYDLVIFHNLPSDKFPIQSVLRDIKLSKTSSLFFVGSNTSIARFNTAQSALTINAQTSALNQSQAIFDDSFNSFNIDDKYLNIIESMPPLTSQFGKHNLSASAKSIFNQRIKDIDTDESLISVQDQTNIKTGVVAGEGIWKWRMMHFLQFQDYEAIDGFFTRLFQFLSTKEDKRRFRTNLSQNVFKETESIFIDAQLYNDNFELINEPEVIANIRQGNTNFDFTFSRKNNYYFLDAGRLAPGNYRYEASTSLNGEELTSNGNFTVQDVELEQFDLTANHGLLYQLAEKSGGSVVYPNELLTVSDEIKSRASIKPVIYYSNSTEKLLDQKWIFFVIAFLLALEWFIRRFLGAY